MYSAYTMGDLVLIIGIFLGPVMYTSDKLKSRFKKL